MEQQVKAYVTNNMPAPSAPPDTIQLSSPFPIFGTQYCCPYVCDLKITTKMLSMSDKHFDVMDVNDNMVFKLKGYIFTIHDRRHLIGASGNVVATLRANLVSLHDRWQVFKGDSNSHKDLVFTARRSAVLQFKTNLDVFLAKDKDKNKADDKDGDDASSEKETKEKDHKHVPDYKVAGSWHEKSCAIYIGESKTIVAQMREKLTGVTLVLGKDHFGVTIYPYVDYAFVVSLIIILDAINKEDRK